MCVDVIALGRKGLASNDAKKKKFPSYSTCTYNEMICIILTRVYYCWGLPSSFEGYFVLPAAVRWEPEVTHVVLIHIPRWCAGRAQERERTHTAGMAHTVSLWISSFTNFYINLKTHFFPHFFPQANCPPLLSPTCLAPRKAEYGGPEARGGTLSWLVLSLQATKTHLGGKVLFFFHVSLLR